MLRSAAALAGRSVIAERGLITPVFSGPVRARVTVYWERYLSTGRYGPVMTYRRSVDPDNLDAALKPLWDGLQDAGILGNDRYLIREPVQQERDPEGAGKIVVTLRRDSDAHTR
jgi:hypothetical protein